MSHKKKIISTIVGVCLVVVVIAVVATVCHRKSNKNMLQHRILVKLTTIKTSSIPIIATANGNLEAKNETDISPKVPGYVKTIGFKDGQFVKAGTILVQLDDRKQRDDLAAAKTDVDSSRLQYNRDFNAYKKGLLLQNQLYQAKVTLEKDQAVKKSDETLLHDMTITAPFSGYISARQFSLGDYVGAGQKLTTLIDRQHLRVVYDFPSNYAPQLRVGQSVNITASFLPKQVIHATVNYIAPLVDPNSQTIEVHALISNDKNQLKPGQYVNVEQRLGIQKGIITVPESAIFSNLSGYHVFTVKNGKAVSVPVKIGLHTYSKTQIIAGLKPGDQIITTGQNQVVDGMPVKVVLDS